MAKIKLTKSAVDAAQPQDKAIELRDTVVPGFLCKITPAGRKVFMLQYRTNAGERRKPALGQYGELTVDQARTMAQEWLAEVRKGGDPSAAKNAARKAPTMKEFCHTFMEDYSKQRNKPSTQRGYQGVIDRCILPIMGRMKVQDVKRPDVAALMKKLAYKQAEANRTFGVLRKMFNLAEVWGLRPDGTNPCRHVPMYPPGKETRLIVDDELVRIFRHLEHLEAEGLENYVIPLAIRLQFEFAARRSEICPLEWGWIDLEKRRLEALRRTGIVERLADGLWKVPDDLAERGRQYDAQRLGGVAVELKSHLPIERQARVIGATWLDQQLIGGGRGLGDLGFGGDTKQAMQRRAEFLEEQGLAQRHGQRVILARNLLETLRNRELAQAAKGIVAETGLEHRPVTDGQRVAGIYRRSVMLASGRYAMLDDGMGFSLVPWRPVIEQRLGQQLAASVRGGGVTWEIGRQRGPAIM